MKDRREGKRTNHQYRSVPHRERNRPEEPVRPGDDWVPLQVPENMEEMLLHWANYEGPKVGWCFLCDRPILSEDDFIPETNTHNCAAGWRFEREHSRL
jgi:hypothetical protein